MHQNYLNPGLYLHQNYKTHVFIAAPELAESRPLSTPELPEFRPLSALELNQPLIQ